MAHAFDALVVEIDVSNFHIGWQRVGLHRKAVIVRSYFDVAIAKIFHWLIAAAMTETKLESLAAESAAQQLMAEADAKCRRARLGYALHFFNFFGHRSRIAWPI